MLKDMNGREIVKGDYVEYLSERYGKENVFEVTETKSCQMFKVRIERLNDDGSTISLCLQGGHLKRVAVISHEWL